jgi:hypothetical protein
MFTRDIFDDVLDQIAENTTISRAFIEEDIEDYYITVNKHIGILAHLILGRGLVNDELLKKITNDLIQEYNYDMCKHHALEAITKVNRRFVLYLATYAEL